MDVNDEAVQLLVVQRPDEPEDAASAQVAVKGRYVADCDLCADRFVGGVAEGQLQLVAPVVDGGVGVGAAQKALFWRHGATPGSLPPAFGADFVSFVLAQFAFGDFFFCRLTFVFFAFVRGFFFRFDFDFDIFFEGEGGRGGFG